MKIFTRVLVPDVEYKTLSISRTTTCRELINMLLLKFRLRHRDPNLFFLTIDVWIRKTGIPIRSVMVLDEKTCPAQLQAVYPQQGTKFTLQMRRGGFVRLSDDSCLTSSAVRIVPLLPVLLICSLFVDAFVLLFCVHKEDVLFPAAGGSGSGSDDGGETRARLKDVTGRSHSSLIIISIVTKATTINTHRGHNYY